ncbi:Scr1 family TA system antitoxin-like transcriptional regulator [Streptomyces sp. NBC_01006]|uniref:helix-turn-helix domain-containing protein n=1 Tax=Streptomyces sp. NBC_01006 TaxID=2903716 RepID=UPI00386AAB14|nr:helix-turn-helix transcriptional regulator [Streptomyces sp. NBC_01006]
MKMVGAMVAVSRVAKNLTQKQLGELVGLEEQTIASIEQGRRALMPDVADLLDRLLGLPGVLAVASDQMPAVDVIPPWAEEYMDREREAVAISWFNTHVLPGLLQTEEYARALFGCRVPYLGVEEIEVQVSRRMERQEILDRPVPPTLSFIIWEPAVRDRIGGDEVYREQLRHLRACADRPGISLQILPLGLTGHAGLGGPFILLETPEHQHLFYAETQRGSVFRQDPEDVSILTRKYAMLRSQALNFQETKALLDRLSGER